jgi:hypothetical protein
LPSHHTEPDDGPVTHRATLVTTAQEHIGRTDLAAGQVGTIAEGFAFTQALPGDVPIWGLSGVGVAPSGAIYMTEDATNTLYRITVHP